MDMVKNLTAKGKRNERPEGACGGIAKKGKRRRNRDGSDVKGRGILKGRDGITIWDSISVSVVSATDRPPQTSSRKR